MLKYVMVATVLGCAGQMTPAAVELPDVISDNMVLQRSEGTRLWGTAAAGERVSARFGGVSAHAVADAKGAWELELNLRDATDEPGDLVIEGTDTITIHNAVVGDVWFCGGQSNMEFTVDGTVNFQQEEMDFPLIRQFYVNRAMADQPLAEAKGEWRVATPESVPLFTAVGFYFGREIFQKTGRPIGLINASWGGTGAEAWTSEPQLNSDPHHRKMVDDLRGKHPGDPSMPAVLYNGMIAPIVKYRIHGVLWYQGEGNATRCDVYEKLMTLLIEDWRCAWGIGDFPFYLVQLANYGTRAAEPVEDDAWARVREAQRRVSQKVPNTALATAVDIGDAEDIHPRNKQEVGHRLALIALARDYGFDVAYEGPDFESMAIEGNTISMQFAHADGLHARGDKLSGFAVAGEDGRYVWAEGKIEGNRVVVWSNEVEFPRRIRYGWDANPETSLYNGAGLPALPFEAGISN